MKIDWQNVPVDEADEIRRAIKDSDGKKLEVHCTITDAGVAALAGALQSSKLRDISLGSRNITNNGAIALATALPTSKLKRLALGSDIITDKGAIALAKALTNSKLTELYLCSDRITNTGARHFLAAIPRSKVTGLDLEWTGVCDGIQDAIRYAVAVRPTRNKLFLLLRLMAFWRSDGDNAMLHRIARFLMG